MQGLAHLRPPASVLATFVLLTSIPFIHSSPPTFACALLRSWLPKPARLTTYDLHGLFNTVMRALTTKYLRVRITMRLPTLWRTCDAKHPSYDTYRTPGMELLYWRIAERYRRRLYSGGSQVPVQTQVRCGEMHDLQLVEYYTPRLLPLYREKGVNGGYQGTNADFTISAKTYCKWHRMVYPDRPHPTPAQAKRKMRHHSSQDLREMFRISRLLSDERVFRVVKKNSTKYKEMWEAYLDRRSMDIDIVFE
ncbi:hypothetical protein ID866_10149 [Astraeus odoratus]|nr:hypothetical protein ID866_10149 [Astraeus odoratus]